MKKPKRDISNLEAPEQAEEICAEIRRERDEEERVIMEKALKERERLLAEASTEAEKRRASILAGAGKDIEHIKERIFSTVSMEKKRIHLDAKANYIKDIFDGVRREAQAFRGKKDYTAFLKKVILEGLEVIGREKAVILYSRLDGAIFNDSFAKDIRASSGGRELEFRQAPFSDTGVMMESADKRLSFDNRFEARLKRRYDELYMDLAKEAF